MRDVARNCGFVGVGVSHETAEFAVSHYPPGGSKWNWIEHRLFCHTDFPTGGSQPGMGEY